MSASERKNAQTNARVRREVKGHEERPDGDFDRSSGKTCEKVPLAEHKNARERRVQLLTCVRELTTHALQVFLQ